ncbi:MAG: helix-turn-helix domain-containing protein, partial [Bacteroidota bacterium]
FFNRIVGTQIMRQQLLGLIHLGVKMIAKIEKGILLAARLKAPNINHPKVYQAQELLAHNLSTDYTVEELSRELLISSRQLGRLFKRHAGQTIHAFRSRLRLERAEQLLLHSEQSVNEIALECGFVQARQFIRFWKQAKGTTPGEWRKQKIGVGKD